ncbi:pentapeptide repeat-containing protein [Tsukamurella soli]|uniref:Pentapeptide repeat-containing protein n=1 Tax=Tsukamurella soli TaxID=644556 RepID=A0ABP8JIS6_9ACTN
MIEIRNLSGVVIYTAQSATDVRAAVIEANLRGANLCGADLRGANLRGANLRGADLYGANLRGANLYGANLYGANLRGANLRGADLYGADLCEADLRGANLYGANLYGANLCEADLRGANLRGADLYGADLRGAKEIPALAAAQTVVAPESGSVEGWKKALDNRIVHLRIPKDAARSNATGRKCRASKAKVLAIFNADGSPAEEAFSRHDPRFRYEVGKTVKPDNGFDADRWNECASGIHFFVTRAEAEARQ